ncbi:MAG: InlB B-repeat-containing protein [Clostridia bacterium]|nr:InlB B-repeat-containing protein [Clostridia bacterium]
MKRTMKFLSTVFTLVALLATFSLILASCGAPAETYTVTFDAENGTTPTTVDVVKGKLITEPTAPTKDGFYFGGWYLADSAWNFAEWPVSADVILTAKWIEKGAFDDYALFSITEARAAEKGAKFKVDGIVASITYAFGRIPSGIILVDEGASICVYDKNLAAGVKVGNKIEIAAEKDYWILEDEASNAAKYGYKGSNQLANATLLSNDGKTDNTPDFSWIETTTVKKLLNTPITEDNTTLLYKVNALVSRDAQAGFTNYYFNDLDGVTGSYTYTQCNGSDFAWLDEFDGKICTVYLTAINAKSTASGCVYRLLPVSVKDEGFKFDTANTTDFVMEYHVRDLFRSLYTGNPKTELCTKIDSALLGFEGATVSYESDNENVIKITADGDKIILDIITEGTANVTATVTYNGKSVSETFKIERAKPSTAGALTIPGAIAKELGESITVTGIVGPSIVNKTGFYLIDKDAVIAVIVKDQASLSTIKIGDEIILTGKRDRFHNGNGDHAGQTCITNAVIDANLYGENSYSTESFITGMTATEFYNLDKKIDYSTSVFVITVKIVYHEAVNQTPAKYTLSDGTTEVNLYCSGPDQYAWLAQFVGETVTVEVTACNWNNKSYWRGCVLSVTDGEGNKVYNTLNFN